MLLVRDISPRYARQLRHTLVEGRDRKHYKILTHQLYDREPPPEFHNFEVNVQQVNADGAFRELVVPYYTRYYSKEEALAHHQRLLETFDEALGLEEAKGSEAHKKTEEAAH